MNVVKGLPPNFGDVVAVFPNASNPGVIFTYGDTIYNPSGILLTPELHAHEGIHCGRQGDHVEDWWIQYLRDAEFRLNEELLAHRAEYRTYAASERDRNTQNSYLRQVARRLAGPLYGNMITEGQAIREIKK